MRITFTLLFLVCVVAAKSQLLTWSPDFIQGNSDPIEITVDATKGNQGLKDYANTSDVYVHTGLITDSSKNSGDWRYVKYQSFTTPSPTVQCTYLGSNKWKFTITGGLRAFYNVTNATEKIQKIAILFRNGAGSKVQRNTDGSDMYVPVYDAGLYVRLDQPFREPKYVATAEAINKTLGDNIAITAKSSQASALTLYFNGTQVATAANATSISANPTITGYGTQTIIAQATNANGTKYDTTSFFVTSQTTVAPLPAGVREGINYGSDCTTATLVLFAPNKTNVIVVGDFAGSDWTPKPAFQMNKTPDGNYYWITLTNLVAGTEYAFNYVVDNSIYIADPYTEKVLDPYNDQYISSATYPNLKPYPTNANVSASQNGIMSVLQTCQPTYNWQAINFTRPDKRNLITYELLVRDFGDAHSYQMLIDTISYFKRLGINAIELMPVNEFNGNDSWGYNPTFYCALDKYYGTKNKFKEFIDLCHQNGIAVIMDVVYNQMEAEVAPQGKLYWDAAKNRPATNNPWLNIVPPHPYFDYEYDLNHESSATQYLVERSLEYWLSEYKVDGFRIDGGKGFTQKCTQVNDLCPVANGSIEDYDASRVANLERYYDSIQLNYPNTYMILEFLGTQRPEEQEYAKHGFMLWGNNNPAYNQATMGYTDNSNFSKIVYSSGEEAFTTPSEMGYMESHDEERLMFKNEAYGNSSGSYNVKDIPTALQRNAGAAAVFFTVPGPKMIWQFGERGYDSSINSNGGRTNDKAPHWEYMQDPNRLNLWNAYSKLIHLRLQNPGVFNNTTFSYDFYDNGGLFRRFQIADSISTGLKVTVIANFDVTPQTRTVTFQSTGTWYSFLSNGTGSGLNGAEGTPINISSTSQSIVLQPGEYHVYLDRQVALPLKLLSFNGRRNTDNIALAWITSNEVNVKNFTVERSFDGNVFNSVATVAAKNIATGEINYNYADRDPLAVKAAGKIFYRLRMTDIDGQYSYSNVAVINSSASSSHFSLYPNPVKGSTVYLTLDEPVQSAMMIKIEDVSGRVFKNYTLSGAGTTIPVDVNNLAAGMYLIKVETAKSSFVQQFVIQR